ncbi:squalene--hopene cyclase, partial [bacterium]|nr:squalene--hopene cyclase [bacterium]
TNGLRFLLDSVGESGGWAIDTNLATWGTTLSVKALMQNKSDAPIPPDECARIKQWMLAQQYKTEHPYTHAAPGGWAWTDLPGGVPDADDTSGALLALPQLAAIDDAARDAALRGAEWLMNLQNRDGGMPTFCRGWGALPFDQSCCDITAHALRAILTWRDAAPPAIQKRIDRFQQKALSFLRHEQTEAGAWKPLWFGNENEERNINWTYGTAIVVSSLSSAFQSASFAAQELASDGAAWLVRAQNDNGGWGGAANIQPSIEETALAVEALCKFYSHADEHAARKIKPAIERGVDWLVSATQMGSQFDAAPIGFYFAELWYFEKLYSMIFTMSALNAYAGLNLTARS